MNRKEEIKELLKHLLGKTVKAIDNNHYSQDIKEILKSSEEVLIVSKQIESYIAELNEISA